MSRQPINPPAMYESVSFGFSHAIESTGARTLHLAGQVAWDGNAQIVGANDLAKQAEKAFANLTEVLAEAGMTAENVVRLRTYVVDYSPDKIEIIGPAIGKFYGSTLPAANTLIGVAALAMPEFLIEIEATAVAD